ncbi:MAG: hypothetical protein ABI411_14075 [Tahibacter sp.]
MRSIKKLMVAFTLMLCASAVSPLAMADQKPDPALRAASKESFDGQSAAILAQMKAGERWEFVTAAERKIIERRLDEISTLLGGAESLDTLSPDQKGRLLVAQEDVNAILTKKDGNRIICLKEAPIGSHRRELRCETFANREHERVESRKYMHDSDMKHGGLYGN